MPFNTRLLSACALAVASAGVALTAGSHRPVEIPDRIRGAERVVVAQVARRDARYQRNQFGDELIVSHVVLQVHETIKGTPARVITLELEGGTVDGLTMHVSDLPGLEPGELGVFFLDHGEADLHVPHLRGQGILKLDDMDRVDGSSLTLDMIREMARQVR